MLITKNSNVSTNDIVGFLVEDKTLNYIRNGEKTFAYISKIEKDFFHFVMLIRLPENFFELIMIMDRLKQKLTEFNQLHNTNYTCVSSRIELYDFEINKEDCYRIKDAESFVDLEVIFKIKEV